MSEVMGEVRIVCDRAALHPKHPEPLVIAFRPGLKGGWSVSLSRGHGTGPVNGSIERFVEGVKRANGDVVTLIGDEKPGFGPVLLDALLGRRSPTEDEIQMEREDQSRRTRKVFHIECRRCHHNPADVREDRLWEVLDLVRHAGRDRVTLAEVHSILQALALEADRQQGQTAPSE